MKTTKHLLCALALLVTSLVPAGAVAPEYVNYQGQLNASDGQPLPTGNYTIEFNIYGSAAGNDLVWGPFLFDDGFGNGHGAIVPVLNGRFNVIIGQRDTANRLISTAFGAADRFIEIKVNGGSPILPRQQFLSAAYAFGMPNVTPNATGVGITGNTTVSGSLTANGNLGVGATPAEKLHVVGNGRFDGANARLVFMNGATLNSEIGVFNNTKLFVANKRSGDLGFETAGTERLTVTSSGTVGIGTPSPNQARLVVSGTATDSVGSHAAYMPDGGILVAPAGSYSLNDVSIKASHAVHALYFRAVSDARIKDIQGRSDAATDLATLSAIEIVDYTHKDKVGTGHRPQKKVIGQQVEEVFPQAVNQTTDVVPDIYQRAPIEDGWVTLATDLKVGDRVKLISRDAQEIREVLEVAEGKFRTDFKPAGDHVFVFGREVNDFRTVDYEAIAMLNVSATQELARRVENFEAREARVAALEQEIATLKRLVVQLAAGHPRDHSDRLTRASHVPGSEATR